MRLLSVLPSSFLFLRLQQNYRRVLRRLRREASGRKIKVLFLIGDSSKWKCQLIYDKMLVSPLFDPYVVPTLTDREFIEPRFQAEKLSSCREFFLQRGMRCLDAVSLVDLKTVPLAAFEPDIVIYQQPWGLVENQSPAAVSRRALTFYVPYYTVCLGGAYMQVSSAFHRSLYGNFLENEEWIAYYQKQYRLDFRFAKMIPCGSPFREELARARDEIPMENAVVYAPHWSFPQAGLSAEEEFSTFLETGRFMLEYAKCHADVKWIFKPHPLLKVKLLETGVWSADEVADYWSAWQSLGVLAEDGDYAPWFARSRAMVTDSQSFLSEYLVLNRPLIRLEPKGAVRPFLPPAAAKLQGMYRVKTLAELVNALHQIVELRLDPLRETRTVVIHQMRFDENDISRQMVDYFTQLVGKTPGKDLANR